MARSFNGSSDKLTVSNSFQAAQDSPFTIAAWVRPSINTTVLTVAGVSVAGSSGSYHRLFLWGGQTGNPVGFQSGLAGSGSTIAQTATGFVINQWQHVCGVLGSTSDRRVYLNGGGKGTNTATRATTTMNETAIGVNDGNGTSFEYFNGQIAHVAMWNEVLTDEEIAVLANGLSPLLIRPDSLAYWSLDGISSPELCKTNPLFPMGVTGTAFYSDEPPVSKISSTIVRRSAIGLAAGLNVAITGAGATASAGTVSLAITSNVSVSGAAATSGAGTPSETVSVVSPGASATSAAGTPSHEIDVVSPGAGANTTAGTVTASLGVPVIGTPATASSGIVLASEAVQPLGAPATASSGTIVPSVAITETGAAANSAAGTVSFSGILNVPVTGASATSSSGTVIPSISFVLPGAAASASAGTATASDSPQPLGASATSASGTVSLGITSNFSLMGSSAVASAGLLQALGISSSILIPGVVPGQPASGATLVAGVVPGQPASGGTVAPGVVPGQPASGATLVAGVAG